MDRWVQAIPTKIRNVIGHSDVATAAVDGMCGIAFTYSLYTACQFRVMGIAGFGCGAVLAVYFGHAKGIYGEIRCLHFARLTRRLLAT